MLEARQLTVLFWTTLLTASETYAQNWSEVDAGIPTELALGEPLFGASIDLQAPSLVNFWATWCAPCIKEIPDLNAAGQALDQQVILVNVGESIEDIEKFASKNPDLELGRHTIVTQGFEFGALRDWRIRGLPTTFLVRNQQALWQAEGILPWADSEVQAGISARLTAP